MIVPKQLIIMKKNLLFKTVFPMLTALLLLASCHQEDETVVPEQSLQTPDAPGVSTENITCNLVSSPRVLTVRGYNLTSQFSNSLNAVIDQYNDAGSDLQFVRVDTASADITVYTPSGGSGISVGFPSGGNPYPYVAVYSGTSAFGSCVINYAMARGLGTAIGLRAGCSTGSDVCNCTGTVGICSFSLDPALSSAFIGCSISSLCGLSAYDELILNAIY